jgi:hypothetical protein
MGRKQSEVLPREDECPAESLRFVAHLPRQFGHVCVPLAIFKTKLLLFSHILEATFLH